MSKIKSFGSPTAREDWRGRASRRAEHAGSETDEGAANAGIVSSGDPEWGANLAVKRATTWTRSLANRIDDRQLPGDAPSPALGNAGTTGATMRLLVWFYAFLLLIVGLVLAIGGVQLAALGGSPYYLAAGVLLVSAAFGIGLGRRFGLRCFAVFFLGTTTWAFWEVGVDAWALVPRLNLPLLLGLPLALPAVCRAVGLTLPWRKAAWRAALGALALGLVAHQLAGHRPEDPMYRNGTGPAQGLDPVLAALDAGESVDWRQVGHDSGGMRFSRLMEITPENVAHLKPAWVYRTGDSRNNLSVTPLKVGDTVYLCTGGNDVIALDAETGAQRWRFYSDAEKTSAVHRVCRGVAYFRVPDAQGACSERIITNTIDARLIALDAHSGELCEGFGEHGQTSLLTGMGDWQGRSLPGYYAVTSAPTIVRGKVVLGGWVSDAQYWGEPSGVIRAYDAVTGRFAWAFDMGRPDRQGEPPPGENYTPSTPNAWAPMSADAELGLVYVPTGNTSGSDYYGAKRRPFDEQYSSSVLALDADTGRVRWSFQTVHHDLWDYDTAPQPVVVDLLRDGKPVKALIQGTKTGELFVLDRRDGRPVFDVREVPAPVRGGAPEERIAPTQPISSQFPSFRGPDLDERAMWGITALDQLWCRVQFKQARYDGIFTVPGPTPFIQYPGILGGMNWASVSINPERQLMFVNASRVANYVRLVPRADADAEGRKPELLGGEYGQRAQIGTPYAVSNPPFRSPLGVPCQSPPYGTLSAVDLATGKLVWTQRLGDASNSGPMGIPTRLPLPLGTPTSGGSLATRSGLLFIAAAQDLKLRAIEASSGRELWHGRLPVGGFATPMTYLSPSGRQFVLIAAGGIRDLTDKGDYVLAFALPKSGEEDRPASVHSAPPREANRPASGPTTILDQP